MTISKRQTSMRTHMCGEIGTSDISQTVTVCGWVAKRREHGDKLAFVDLRDHSGIVQCVIDNAVDVRSEFVVKITGVVRPRPDGTINANLSTGAVEIGECVVEVLRSAEPPPFPVDARADDVVHQHRHGLGRMRVVAHEIAHPVAQGATRDCDFGVSGR